jgi:hypothetical protein
MRITYLTKSVDDVTSLRIYVILDAFGLLVFNMVINVTNCKENAAIVKIGQRTT